MSLNPSQPASANPTRSVNRLHLNEFEVKEGGASMARSGSFQPLFRSQSIAISKQQFQRELQLSGVRRGRDLSGRVAVAASLKNHRIRVKEIRVVQQVESLGPELQIESL